MCALAKQSPFIHARPPAHIAIHGDASPSKHTPAASAAHSESSSVLALRQKGQESAQVGALPARNGSPVATSHRPGTPIATTNSNPAKIRNFFTNLSAYIRAEFTADINFIQGLGRAIHILAIKAPSAPNLRYFLRLTLPSELKRCHTGKQRVLASAL